MKLHFPVRAIAALAVYLSICAPAIGAIDLLPKELIVRDKPATAKIVNNGDHPEYVSVSLARLLNPGEPLAEEKLEPIGETASPTLYAYPFRITLAPGQSKTITIKPIGPVDTETVYRLDVKPEIKLIGQELNKAVGGVVVNLAFSGLVRQLPAKGVSTISVACDAQGANLTATGSVRYRVKDATVDGHAMDAFNVYPGVPRSLKGRIVKIPGQPTCRSNP